MMGAELRAERERQGLTIQDVERETSIRAAYLQALEREDYSALPNEVYVKGFIRNYASFLHMDPEKLVQEYRETIHGADVGPIPKANPETTSLVNESAPFSSGSDFHERVEKSHRKQIILTLVAFYFYYFGADGAADARGANACCGAEFADAERSRRRAECAACGSRPDHRQYGECRRRAGGRDGEIHRTLLDTGDCRRQGRL